MPRQYKRKSHALAYRTNYTEQDLADAIAAVKGGGMISWKAAKEYGIPKGTLINKLNNRHPRKPGPPTVLSAEEEASIVTAVSAHADWIFH